MAKRERDGWRVEVDRVNDFTIVNGANACWVYATAYGVAVHADGQTLTPARAIQFAEKLQAIAERAAKEVR